jgi:aspartyl-tRNA(Asn)/glutamyl-tRNA(Gln) amidotransferase subunit A
MQPHEWTISEARKRLDAEELSAEELTRSVLSRIDQVDPGIKAFITVCPELALKQAQAADVRIKKGEKSTLLGIPVALKDVMCTSGVRTTCASKILEHFVPPYDATVVDKLFNAGAVLVGKTNMDEFAMGSTTENSGLQTTRNPWDPERIPGGSSGGSAAAVAADMCLAALGSDTGGSIRQPASHCGMVGLKPTYGRVSRYGLVAFASSLDQIGPITKDVTDCALMMNVISGHDSRDSTSVPKKVPDYEKALSMDITGLRIGIPKAYFEAEGLDPEVRKAVEEAIDFFKSSGAVVVSIDLPHSKYAVAAYYVIAPAEASSNLARYDGVKYGYRDAGAKDLIEMYHRTRTFGFGPEVRRRIIIGTYALSAGYYDAYYGKASQVRSLIIEDFKQAFSRCDVILSPVAPTPAFKIGEKVDDPLALYLSDIFTLSTNLAGIPGISVPCGFSSEGLPIGVQLMADHFGEEMLLKAAYHFEQGTDFHKQKPRL